MLPARQAETTQRKVNTEQNDLPQLSSGDIPREVEELTAAAILLDNDIVPAITQLMVRNRQLIDLHIAIDRDLLAIAERAIEYEKRRQRGPANQSDPLFMFLDEIVSAVSKIHLEGITRSPNSDSADKLN